MDDVDSRDFDTKDFGSEDIDDLIIYGDSSAISSGDEPIPFDDGGVSSTSVSHSPLDLDGTSAPQQTPTDFEVPPEPPKAFKKKSGEKIVSAGDRITGVKTFFSKLHPGALEFLDEQIANWLRENPGLVIRRTNTATGNVVGKMTEPNIIITIWY